MVRSVTPGEFQAAVPTYIAQAHYYASGILNRGFDYPGGGVQVAAALYMSDESETPTAYVTDPVSTGAIYRQRPPELAWANADCPVEIGRLAIEDISGYTTPRSRSIRAWAYMPTTDELFGPGVAHPSSRWVRGESRQFLGNLVLPGYSFDADDGPNGQIQIKTLFHHGNRARYGSGTDMKPHFIDAVPPEDIRTALAPVCTAKDEELLSYGLETYHTTKIQLILNMMRLAAQLPQEP